MAWIGRRRAGCIGILLIGLAHGASASEPLPDPRVARALLRTGQLETLTSWVKTQRRLGGSGFAAFQSLTADETAALRGWVEADPGSNIAMLALAERELAMAWEPRGRERIMNIGAREREVLRTHARAALVLSESVRARDPRSVEADRVQLVAARLLGETGMAERAWTRGLASSAADHHLWAAYLEGFSRRWGGSHAQLEQVAESAQVHVGTNPKLRQLLALAPADRARDLAEAGEFAAAIEQWDLALGYGEQPELLRGRAWTQFQAGEHELALEGLDHVIQLAPFDADAHHRRAHVLMALERYATAAEAAALSADLAPSRDHFAWVQQSAAAKARRIAESDGFAKRSPSAGLIGIARQWWLQSVLIGLFAIISIWAIKCLGRWRRERNGWARLDDAIVGSDAGPSSDPARGPIATLERDE
jgi:tetratricopeptide (TPR) repeat protein